MKELNDGMWISAKKAARPVRVSSGIPVVYLDWSVLVSMRHGEMPELNATVRSHVAEARVVIPFSATHVDELRTPTPGATPSTDPLLRDELRWLGEIANRAYLYDGDNVPYPELRSEDPEVVWNTLHELPGGEEAVDTVLDLVPAEMVGPFRTENGFDPKELNNVSPPGVLAQLDARIAPLLTATGAPTFGALIDLAMKFHPQHETFGFGHRFAAAFTLLNWIGFQPDRDFAGSKRRGSLNDASHAALAACTDVFVSHDKRLLIKAAAAYEYFDVPTLVMDASEAAGWFGRLRQGLA